VGRGPAVLAGSSGSDRCHDRGLIGFGLAFGLAYYGFQRVHAGLGQTLLALTPLAALLLAVLQRQERLVSV
jgi:drug/metabolite transporter (DMT)-like permease